MNVFASQNATMNALPDLAVGIIGNVDWDLASGTQTIQKISADVEQVGILPMRKLRWKYEMIVQRVVSGQRFWASRRPLRPADHCSGSQDERMRNVANARNRGGEPNGDTRQSATAHSKG